MQGGWILQPEELSIGRQIGVGSVGAVCKGTLVSSGKKVAVKVQTPLSPTAPTPSAAQEVQRVLSVGILRCGVTCLPEQAIREDLTVRTRKGNRTLEDVVCEIDQLSKIWTAPQRGGIRRGQHQFEQLR